MTDELSVNMIRISRIWYPFFSGMRSLPGFKTLEERTGLLTYWRTNEWADLCRQLDDGDFACN